jgi:hypothetical protein
VNWTFYGIRKVDYVQCKANFLLKVGEDTADVLALVSRSRQQKLPRVTRSDHFFVKWTYGTPAANSEQDKLHPNLSRISQTCSSVPKKYQPRKGLVPCLLTRRGNLDLITVWEHGVRLEPRGGSNALKQRVIIIHCDVWLNRCCHVFACSTCSPPISPNLQANPSNLAALWFASRHLSVP